MEHPDTVGQIVLDSSYNFYFSVLSISMAHHVCQEVKNLAVRYYLLYNSNYVQVAKYFDCSPRTLERWVRKYSELVRQKYKVK